MYGTRILIRRPSRRATAARLPYLCFPLSKPTRVRRITFQQEEESVPRIVSKPGVICLTALALLAAGLYPALAQRWLHGIIWPEPTVVTPGDNGGAPSDAIVLFDGKNLDEWKGGEKNKIDSDGGFTVRSALETKKR